MLKTNSMYENVDGSRHNKRSAHLAAPDGKDVDLNNSSHSASTDNATAAEKVVLAAYQFTFIIFCLLIACCLGVDYN